MDGRPVLVAEPEKALLDFWYLSRGRWSMQRMGEMRFQNFEAVKVTRLRQQAPAPPAGSGSSLDRHR
ncbi:MAG: hypothetical protein A2X46_11370 [Lentisphaerae bacterium GWF2_57_35]|nr:MAG: hypothetical protein A2X46_11370 [Lentisphaerae bacterium GWF2_57_35]